MKENSSSTSISIKNIMRRLVKVIYAFILFLGLVGTYSVYSSNAPYFTSTYSYLVKCNNGKEFDPTSKPIKGTGKREINETYSNVRTFNVNEVKSECEYGTAYLIRPASELPKNYELLITEYKHPVGTKKYQLLSAVNFFVIYYLVIGILSEIILYIFVGKIYFPKTRSFH